MLTYCKVEFIQLFFWLYSVPDLLVSQHLEILYLGGNHVRVMCEEKLKSVQLSRASRLDLVTGKLPKLAHMCSIQRS